MNKTKSRFRNNKTKSRFRKNKTKSRFRKNKTKSRFRKNKIMVGGRVPNICFWKIYYHYAKKHFRGWYPWDCNPKNAKKGVFDVTYSGDRGTQQKYIVGFVREAYLQRWMSRREAIDTTNIQGISVDSVLDNPKIIGDQRDKPHTTVKLSDSQQIERDKKNFTISFKVNDKRVPEFRVGAAATDWMPMTYQTHSDNRGRSVVPFEGNDAIYPIIFLVPPPNLSCDDKLYFSQSQVRGSATDKVEILNTQTQTPLTGQTYYKKTDVPDYSGVFSGNECKPIIVDARLSFNFDTLSNSKSSVSSKQTA